MLLQVKDIVGERVFQTTSLEAEGQIREVDGKFQLTLRIAKEGGQQVRTLDAKVCKDLQGASAVVLGLHLKQLAAEGQSTTTTNADTEEVNGEGVPNSANGDGQRAAAGQGDGATKPAASPQPKPAKPDSASQPERSPVPRTRYLWLTLPQAGLVVGSLPQSSWTGGLAVGWHSDTWRVWVGGRYQMPQTIAARTVPEVGAVVDKYSAEIGVSHSWGNAWFEAAPGLLAGLDYLVAQGSGDDVASSRATHAFAFVGAGLVLRWLASDWLSVAAGAVGEAPLSRPSLEIQSLGEIEQIAPVHLRLSLGLEWNF